MALSSYDIRFILSVSDRTGNSLRRVGSDMRGVTADAARMKKAFTALDVGRGMQLRGLLGGAALGVAAQQAANFGTLVTKAATQARDSQSLADIGQNTKKLQQEILDLMGQFPASAQEQADAAYDIFSAMNVPLQQGVGLLKLFNMVAVAGATDLETATNAMITILNNFGGSWEKTFKAVNTSFAIIRFGRMEFSEFNDMLNAVIPAAKASGQSLQDVAGAMALVTKLIPSQKQGATAIARFLEVISRSDFRAGAKKLGLSIETAEGELKPMFEIVQELARMDIAKATSTINSLFQVVTATGRGGGRGIQSTVQARRFLILAVKEFKQYEQVQKGVTSATSEFEKRYVSMIGTAGVKWEKFKAQMQALLIMVGAAAIPMFEKLGEKVGKAIDWGRQNRGMIEFAVKAALVVAVTSLVVGTFLKLYGTALIVYTGLRRLVIMGTGIGAAWATLTSITVGLASAITGATIATYAFITATARSTIAAGLAATKLRLMMIASFTLVAAQMRLGIVIQNVTRFIWLMITAMTTWNVTAMRGVLAAGGLLGILGKIAKIGAIGLAINVAVNVFDKKKRDRAWFLAKKGALGSAGLQAIFGTSFGTEKWFASEEFKREVEEFDRQQKEGGANAQEQIKKAITGAFNVKKLMADIKKDLKGMGDEFFNNQMLKDMGFDANALNDQINKLINQPPGGTDKKRLAAEITANYEQQIRSATDALIGIYEGFRDANKQAFGALFQGPVEGEGEEAQLRKAWNWDRFTGGLLEKMKAQLAQFRGWRNNLNKLLKMGFSKEFVAEIKNLGPEALDEIDELLRAGPKRVKQFNSVFAAGKKEVEAATQIDFDAQIAIWNGFGKKTAYAIITGMESAEHDLQTKMQNMVVRVYGGVARTIAEEQAKLNFVVPVQPSLDFGLAPKPGQTIPKNQVRAAGLHGKYAIPAAGNEGLTPQAVYAMGARYEAMARAYGGQWPGNPWPTQQGNSYTFNVNGTFLSEAEMMNNALKQAEQRTRNKR